MYGWMHTYKCMAKMDGCMHAYGYMRVFPSIVLLPPIASFRFKFPWRLPPPPSSIGFPLRSLSSSSFPPSLLPWPLPQVCPSFLPPTITPPSSFPPSLLRRYNVHGIILPSPPNTPPPFPSILTSPPFIATTKNLPSLLPNLAGHHQVLPSLLLPFASMEDRSVEGIFNDFVSRRCGLIKALTTDVEEFYRQCDPEKENLCLYGFPDETWRVTLPEEEVPPELPEPALGINFARDGMQRRDWLSLIAVHSDAWLMSVAFFLGASLDKKERNRLFQLINNLPTVLDVVAGRVKIVKEDKASVNSPLPKVSTIREKLPKTRPLSHSDDEYGEDSSDAYQEDDEEYGGDDQDNTTCGLCGGFYAPKEFWICCDICQRWYHGKCVKITPAKAEHIKQYKCPLCNNKRPRAVGM